MLSDEQLNVLLNLVALDKQGSSKIKTLQHFMTTSTLTKKPWAWSLPSGERSFLIISKKKLFCQTFKIRQTCGEKKLVAYCKSATQLLKKVQHQVNIAFSNTKQICWTEKKKENLTLGKGFPAHQPISSVILYEIKERKKKELFQEKFRHFESWKKKLFSEKSWFYKICAFRSVIFLILEFKFAKLWIFFENFFRCSALDNSKKIFHLLIPVPNILK